MTYLVLARKWRPRSFETLVGQDHVVRALSHALSTQRLHHAWLFTGTRGVGKTTLSRILAKSLNCENGITSTPCGQCRACTEIDAGRFVDYVELDAASNRGVDEMTQLLEQAVYAPSAARFKVYMIDEVHMLTGHAFNAMLKTLEEPPAHVKFILATTDPQKIPVTVLSRCLQFNLKQMTAEAIVGHLQQVLQEEGLPFEVPALRLLAQAASGSMRDALSLTDQAIAYSAGDLSLDAVQGMLGTIDQTYLVQLLNALARGDAREVVRVADELAMRGLSYSGALGDLAVLLSRIAIAQRVPGALPQDDPLSPDLQNLAAQLHPDLVQLFYSVAIHSRGELSLAPDEHAGFVMACLRMLALAPEGALEAGGPGSQDAGATEPSVPNAGRADSPECASLARPAAQEAADHGGRGRSVQESASQEEAERPQVNQRTSPAEHALAASVAPAAEPDLRRQEAANPSESRDRSVVLPDSEGASVRTLHSEDTSIASSGSAAPSVVSSQARSSQRSAYDPARSSQSEDERKTPLVDTQNAGRANHPSAERAKADAAEGDHAAQSGVASPAAVSSAAASSIGSSAPTPQAPQAMPAPSRVEDDYADVPAWEDIPVSYDDFESMAPPADSEVYAGEEYLTEGMDAPVDLATLDDLAVPALKAQTGQSAGTQRAASPKLRDMTPSIWPSFAATLPLTGVASELARQSEWVGAQGNTVTLRVAVRTLAESPGKSRLCTLLSEHFGVSVQLDVEYGATGDETAHAMEQAYRAQRQREAEDAAQDDPFVKELIQNFGGRLIPGSIKAIMTARHV